MKTIKRNILTGLLFATLVSFANTNDGINFDINKVTVEFLAVKKGNTLTIKDEFNTLIYKESVQKNGELLRTFDLSELPQGSYVITLDKDFEIINKKFNVVNQKVAFINEDEVVFKPVMRNENDKILISKFGFSTSKMDVELYYNGELIFNELIKGEKSLSRIYQLSTAKKGDYAVVVTTDGKSYSKNFKI